MADGSIPYFKTQLFLVIDKWSPILTFTNKELRYPTWAVQNDMEQNRNQNFIYLKSFISDCGILIEILMIFSPFEFIKAERKWMCLNMPHFSLLLPNYTFQGILKGEVSLYHWPPVWLVLESAVWQLTIFVFICKTD